jgi:tryptophanyl-tRNA synthetase
LQGNKTKMSGSDDSSCIFLTDTSRVVAKKVQGSFSGGQKTKQLQETLGANLEVGGCLSL